VGGGAGQIQKRGWVNKNDGPLWFEKGMARRKRGDLAKDWEWSHGANFSQGEGGVS